MRWKNREQSKNVEDRRGMKPRTVGMGGGVVGLVVLLAAMYFGFDPRMILNLLNNVPAPQQQQNAPAGPRNAAEEELAEFVSVVLRDTEVVWGRIFAEMGNEYAQPKLVLFTDQVKSACGFANSAVGPFYCPADQQVYIDLGFFQEMRDRFRAPGDFAQAYVVAHEVGHHVQNLLGISDRVDAQRRHLSAAEANDLSVRLELQADFLAGVWARHAQEQFGVLEPGDIEEAINAATAIGDDRLQMEAQGYVVPESFTHGTSEQRVRWFRRGYESGRLSDGDTFSARNL